MAALPHCVVADLAVRNRKRAARLLHQTACLARFVESARVLGQGGLADLGDGCISLARCASSLRCFQVHYGRLPPLPDVIFVSAMAKGGEGREYPSESIATRGARKGGVGGGEGRQAPFSRRGSLAAPKEWCHRGHSLPTVCLNSLSHPTR